MKRQLPTPLLFFTSALLTIGACDSDTVEPEPLEPELAITVDDAQVDIFGRTGRASGVLQVWFSNVTRRVEWDTCETVLERQGSDGEWQTHWTPSCTGEGLEFGPSEPIDEGPGNMLGIGWSIDAAADEIPLSGLLFRLRAELADEDGPLSEEERTSSPFAITWRLHLDGAD